MGTPVAKVPKAAKRRRTDGIQVPPAVEGMIYAWYELIFVQHYPYIYIDNFWLSLYISRGRGEKTTKAVVPSALLVSCCGRLK